MWSTGTEVVGQHYNSIYCREEVNIRSQMRFARGLSLQVLQWWDNKFETFWMENYVLWAS